MKPEDVQIHAAVRVVKLDDQPPDISMQNPNGCALRYREAGVTGQLNVWVAGQVNRAIWVFEDRTRRLIPYNLSELELIERCNCAEMEARDDIIFPRGWSCPEHGFTIKGKSKYSTAA